MSRKQISGSKLYQLIKDSDLLEPSDNELPRYSHTYYIEPDEDAPLDKEYIIFTVKVNYLPTRPVYIDIKNLIDLIYSMTSKSSNGETLKFRSELLDLLNNYAKTS
jgi:hypothetical protein